MSNLQSGADKAQMIELLNSIKIPIMGAGGGFAPVGIRGYFEGQTAPQGWLICDGSTKNIADYPDLATYIASQQGSVNYYGGDGTTTFGLPTMNGMPNGGVDTPDEHIVGEHRETISGILKKKPLYQKTVDCGVMPSNTTKSVSPSVSNLDIIYDIYGVCVGSGLTKPIPMVHTSTLGNQIFLDYNGAEGGIRIITGSDYYSSLSAYITIQYTKTTDSWQTVQEGHSSDGNGVFCIKATVSDSPNPHAYHIYSPNERVVGEWQQMIDGVLKKKPVYEKDYYKASVGNGNTIVESNFISGNNVEQLIKLEGNIIATDKSNAWSCNTDGEGKKLSIASGDLQLSNTSSSKIWNTVIIVQYTKTTDDWRTV